MLFNRKFGQVDSSDQLAEIRSGTGSGWEPLMIDTDISLHLDNQIFFSAPCSQRITLTSGSGRPAGIRQRGLQPVLKHLAPNRRTDYPFHFKAGTRYKTRLAVKQEDFAGRVSVALGQTPSQAVAVQSFQPTGNDWQVYECVLIPSTDTEDGALMVFIDSPGTVWVDSVSLCEESLTDRGFRKDALDITRRIQPTIIRWPGGCFADDYHWKDGIGPSTLALTCTIGPGKAPPTMTSVPTSSSHCVACWEPNRTSASTMEQARRKKPPTGSNTATAVSQTRWGKVCAENGHPEPYGVKYWNIGNELYLPTELGATNGREYGKGFKRFAQAMRAVDPDIQLVAVGCFDLNQATGDNPSLQPNIVASCTLPRRLDRRSVARGGRRYRSIVHPLLRAERCQRCGLARPGERHLHGGGRRTEREVGRTLGQCSEACAGGKTHPDCSG